MKPNHLACLPSLRLLIAVSTLGFAASVVADSSGVQLREFSLSTSKFIASGDKPVPLTATWSSAANAPTGYFVSAHIFPASSSSRTPTDANRFLQHNCSGPIFSCSDPQAVQCTFDSVKRLSCSPGTGVLLSPGTYSIVARACVYDISTGIKEVCSHKESSLIVQ